MNDEFLSEDDKVAKALNDSSYNDVKSLNISKHKADDTFYQNIKNHPALRAILKYRKHLSVINI